MTHQYDTSRRVDPDKLVQYYATFEQYQNRYPLYCTRIDVLKVEGTTIVTEEFWNLSIGNLAHVKVKVRYEINSPDEIQYEIIEGYGLGKKNSWSWHQRMKREVHLEPKLVLCGH